MITIYDTQDAKSRLHTYMVASDMIFEVTPSSTGFKYRRLNAKLIGGAEFGVDFAIAPREKTTALKTWTPMYISPDSLQEVNMRKLAREEPRVGDHLVVSNPYQQETDPRNGIDLLMGNIVAIKKLDEIKAEFFSPVP